MTDHLPTLSPDALVERSIELLRSGQHASGAYVAAPTYPTYRFAWLRDGSFCAYAMDLVGQHDSAAAFHRWVGTTLGRHRAHVLDATAAARDGADLNRMLPTRFTLDGELEDASGEQWPNFQLDGYGTWLWSLGQHLQNGQPLDPQVAQSAQLVTDYLEAAAHLPCYDCWEEFGDGHHTSTLGAVAAGLRTAGNLLARPEATRRADEIEAQLHQRHVRDGVLVKQLGDERVDASTLWLALPFEVFDLDDPVIVATAERIRADLVRAEHGVTRYHGDTFYGGGAWVLLTAWLAWFELASGDIERAEMRYRWIVETASPTGELPEQLLAEPQAPDQVEPWTRLWGPVATPLLWSHAMFLVLDHHRRTIAQVSG